MTSAPSEYPVSVTGRAPKAREARRCPSTVPVFIASDFACIQGLSKREVYCKSTQLLFKGLRSTHTYNFPKFK